MQENQVKTENNLIVSIDWLSFTIHDKGYTPEKIIDFLGFSREKFRSIPRGASGYKRSLKFENITILYDGTENMGIHVNVSGSAVPTVLEAFRETIAVDTPFGKGYDIWEETLCAYFLGEIVKVGKITRIDLAIDDLGCKYYGLDEIEEKISQHKICTKWKTHQSFCEGKNTTIEKLGHTIYFGSPQSEIRLRIYDKQLERNRTKNEDDKGYVNYAWVRWELELHKAKANTIACIIATGYKLGEVAIGILSHYFRIINLDDCNISRCSNEMKWNDFVNNVEKLKITVKKEEMSLEEEIRMFEHQNGRKIAKILVAMGGDKDYFGDLANRYKGRLTARDIEQLIKIGAIEKGII